MEDLPTLGFNFSVTYSVSISNLTLHKSVACLDQVNSNVHLNIDPALCLCTRMKDTWNLRFRQSRIVVLRGFSVVLFLFLPLPPVRNADIIYELPPTPSAHSFGLARHKKQGLRFVMQIYSFKQELPAHFASQWHICDARMTRLWPYFALHNVVKPFISQRNVFIFFLHSLNLEIFYVLAFIRRL